MKYDYNVGLFRRRDATFYYLLGALFTDGNIFHTERISLVQMTSKDLDWLELIAGLAKCPIYPTKDGHGNLSIRSREISQILLGCGLSPNKSLNNRLPDIPTKYLPDFIRGCMDGDGSIPRGKEIQCYLCSSSKNFLLDISRELSFLSIKHAIYEIRKRPYKLKNGKTITPKHPHYRLLIRGQYAQIFLAWAYYPGHPISMPRKNAVAQSRL